MKKRILSFALVLLFCFSMIGTVDLTGEHSHVHADATGGSSTTLGVVDYTDTSITIHTVDESQGYYVIVTGPNNYSESTKVSTPNVNIGASQTTFKEMEAGVDYTLTLYKGEVNVKSIIQKTKTSAPAAPSMPTVAGYGSTNITLNTSADHEYSLDGGATWQQGNAGKTTFYYENQALAGNRVKIKAGTTYNIYARVAETETSEPSANSPALTITTVPVPTSIEFSNIDKTSFTVKTVDGVEYSIDGDTYQRTGTFTGITAGKAYTLYARYAAVPANNSAAGDVHKQTVILPVVSAATSVKDGNILLTFNFNAGTFTLSNIKYRIEVKYTFGVPQTVVLTSTPGQEPSVFPNMPTSLEINTNIPSSTSGAKYSAVITAIVCGTEHTIFTATDAALEGTHTHSYAPATCTEPAKCSCGATSGKPLGHDWEAATCQSPKKCKRCNATEGSVDTAAHVDSDKNGRCDRCNAVVCVHDWSPKNPSCTQDQTCTKCGATKVAPGHTFEAATCTDPKKCKVCGTKEGNALGHTPDSSNVCTRCKIRLVAHDYNDTKVHKTCPYCKKCLNALCAAYIGCDGTASGCNGSSTGKVAHTGAHALCSKCGNCLVADCEQYIGCTSAKCAKNPYGGTIDHTPFHEILYHLCPKCGSCLLSECKNYRGCSETRCLNQGGGSGHLSTHATCSVCGSCLVPTCPLYKGCTTTDCNNRPDPNACSHEWEVIKYEIVPCSEEAKEWGGGSGTFKCKKCLKEEVRAVPASGHTYGERERLANGTWIQKCTMCGKIQVCADQTCGHDFNKYFKLQRTASTDCTVGGVWTYICTHANCGFTVTKTVSAGAHKFDGGVITTSATDTTAGVKTYTCSVCGKKKTETIPATNPCAAGHKYGDWVITKVATCTTAGSKTRTCSVCHNTDTAGIAATGHSFSEYVVVKNSTCKEAGYRVCSCIKCGTEKREDLPLSDHKMVLVSSKEATCVADGSTIYECSVCKTRKETVTPATGKHSFVDDGENAKKCVACGFRYEIVNDGNKKLLRLSDGNVSLTVTGSNADTYFYSVSEKSSGDYSWFDSWMKFLKEKGEVSSDAALIKVYTVEMTNSGEKVALDNSMSATILLPEENKKTSVKVYTIKGNAPVEITDFKRSGSKITVSGEGLSESTGEFFVISAKTAKKSNPAVAIVIGIVAVVAVAGVGGYFLYKKGFFSSAE